jgi:hypothetical protein
MLEAKAKLLDELLKLTKVFEGDEPINGADFVEWFAEWRAGAQEALREVEHA